MSLYLITGGAGFIGSNIVEELVRQNEDVRVLDNFVSGKRENLNDFINRIELIEGDIRDPGVLRKAMKDVDFVLHQAALRSVARSVDDPISTNDVNIGGTLNVLFVAREEGVKRVVYASSSSVYGDNPQLPKVEDSITMPISPYAVSKLTGEYYCRVFNRLYGLETVSLRYFNVFGPRQDPFSEYAAVVPRFIASIPKGISPAIYGDGLQSRDFTYIRNVVQANLLAAKVKGIQGEVFNIASGRRYTVLDIVERLNNIFNKYVHPNFLEPRKGDVRHTLGDISKAEKLLGYRVEVDFEEGLKRTVKWLRAL